MERVRWMPLARAVVYSGQFAHLNLEAGFFTQFPDDALARRLVHVRPPARQRPTTGVGDLAHKENALLLDHRPADIHFWGRIASLFSKKLFQADEICV